MCFCLANVNLYISPFQIFCDADSYGLWLPVFNDAGRTQTMKYLTANISTRLASVEAMKVVLSFDWNQCYYTKHLFVLMNKLFVSVTVVMNKMYECMEKCLISLNGSIKCFQLHIMSTVNNQSVHLDTVLNYLHLSVFI